MEINLRDGIQFPELVEILDVIDVTRFLSPELQEDLLNGVNGMQALIGFIENLPPFLMGFLPPGIKEQITGGSKALQLVKALLENKEK